MITLYQCVRNTAGFHLQLGLIWNQIWNICTKKTSVKIQITRLRHRCLPSWLFQSQRIKIRFTFASTWERLKAVKRVKHLMPSIHELIHDLNGCTILKKLDHNQMYHQIKFQLDGRYITTFSSHPGLHRYRHLNFGLNAASEKFQQIRGLEGVHNRYDYIITGSKNQHEHEHVLSCLQRLKSRYLTLSMAKCEFFRPPVEGLGTFSVNKVYHQIPGKYKLHVMRHVQQIKRKYDPFLV